MQQLGTCVSHVNLVLFSLLKPNFLLKKVDYCKHVQINCLHIYLFHIMQTVSLNKYDLLANIHSRSSSNTAAHGGPGFLGWHRVFLLL